MKFVMVDEFEPWTTRWPDETSGPWQVTLQWRWSEDRAACVGFSLTALDGSSESISATLIRSVPVMQLVARARRERFERAGGGLVEALDDGQELDVSPGLEQELRAHSGSWEERRPGRPVSLGLDHYREVARTYSAAHAAGSAPLVAVQKQWQVARPTASRWVAAARSEGLLPATERGRARGNVNLVIDEKESGA